MPYSEEDLKEKLPDFVQRISDEKKELKERVQKLQEFLGSSKYLLLSDYEKSLLTNQYSFMAGYLATLEQRFAFYYVGGKG